MINDFSIGVASGLSVAVLVAIAQKSWPYIKDRVSYRGISVAGTWEIFEPRNDKNTKAGRIELSHVGSRVTGSSTRTKTRDGKKANRKFLYNASINGNQLTLTFENASGQGFDTGTYVFTVQNDGINMVGMATFHGKRENQIVSEPRILKKVAV